MAVTRSEDLRFLGEFIDAGKVAPVLDRTYPLSGVPDAIRRWEAGHARGKAVYRRAARAGGFVSHPLSVPTRPPGT